MLRWIVECVEKCGGRDILSLETSVSFLLRHTFFTIFKLTENNISAVSNSL